MASQPFQKETIDYSWILFQHLKLISEHISGASGFMSSDSANKLVTYKRLVMHVETLIYPYLSGKEEEREKYWKEKRPGFMEKLEIESLKSSGPGGADEYYNAATKWLQMLVQFAHNNQLLRARTTYYQPDDEE